MTKKPISRTGLNPPDPPDPPPPPAAARDPFEGLGVTKTVGKGFADPTAVKVSESGEGDDPEAPESLGVDAGPD
jgi:hypothetical protein